MNSFVIEPTPAFWVSLLPVPFLLYFNAVVALRMWELRTASRGRSVRYPAVYYRGRALGVISACFALLPAVLEWRVFVLNPYWAISYLIGGVLGVWALLLVRRGLRLELKALALRSKPTRSAQRSKKSS